jgi:hypothetical protein
MRTYAHTITEARARYRPLLDELLELYPALAQKPPAWRAGYERVGHLAHGWYLRCHRGIESILLLDEAGYAEEASPLRRSVIEHCVALRWLAAEGNKILDTIARGHARDAQKRGGAVARSGWTSISVEDIQAVIAEIDTENRDKRNDDMLAFAHRLAAYGDKHSEPGYLAECARTHPGYESAIAYVDLDDGDLLSESRDSVWQVPFCTTHLLEALTALRTAFATDPWEETLDRIIPTFTAVSDAVRHEDGLPAVDWSSGTLRA